MSKSTKKIAVVGPNADDEVLLWGNYNGTPIRTITILDGIKSKISAGKILYYKGCDLVEDKVTESYLRSWHLMASKDLKPHIGIIVIEKAMWLPFNKSSTP